MKPINLGSLNKYKVDENKELIDDKYFPLTVAEIMQSNNSYHPETAKELYKSICIPSAINAYSLCIEYMKQWFLHKLPEGMFPEESINIDGKNIFDDYRRLTKQEIIARKKPSLTIAPSIDYNFDNDKIDTHPYGLSVYSPTGFWKGSFFRDSIRDMYLGIIMKVLLMQFQFKIRVETKSEQLDLYDFMKVAYRISYSTGEEADMDIHIPYDLIMQVAYDAGFKIDKEKNKIINIPAFLKYLNQNSDIPFIYKYRTISGNNEFFLRMNGLYIHIKPQSLEVDDGEMEGKTRNNYIITYECEVRFPAPRMFSYYSSNEHKMYKMFSQEDTKPVYGSNSIVNFATFKITDIPDTNKYGWKIHVTTVYEDEESKGKILTINFNELFEGDLLRVIRHSISTGFSPNMWMHIVLNNDRKFITYDMDWVNLILTTKEEVSLANTNIAIYVDQNYMKETILFLDDAKSNRIDAEFHL